MALESNFTVPNEQIAQIFQNKIVPSLEVVRTENPVLNIIGGQAGVLNWIIQILPD